MTTTSFRRLLSANAISSVVGTGIQALTAPVFLLALSVDQYASILLAQTVASYLTFFLNGFYYSMMNSITQASIQNRSDRARQMYTLGYISIVILCILAIAGVGVTAVVITDLRSAPMLIWVAVLGGFVNLGYILVDANFRVRDEYTLGVNILAAARLSDFAILVAALMITKDLLLSLLFNVFTRVFTMFVLKIISERGPRAVYSDANAPSLSDAARYLASARGQLGLSAYTALSTMGPQLAVSTFFPGDIAVAFNVHRTYMRIVAALVNIVTASSWPVLNSLHARGESSGLAVFLNRLIVRSVVATSVVSGILFLIAPWLFPILFHGKISVNSQYLLVIGLACIFNGGTTIAQTLYLATNLRSAFVLTAFLLTAIELVLMTYVGLYEGFQFALLTYSLCELIIMISAVAGCLKTLRLERAVSSGLR